MRRVDELVTRGRSRGQDAEPCERVFPLIRRERTGGDCLAGNAPETVAASHEVRLERLRPSVRAVVHAWPGGVELVHTERLSFEQQVSAGFETRSDEILYDLLLAVHRDRKSV